MPDSGMSSFRINEPPDCIGLLPTILIQVQMCTHSLRAVTLCEGLRLPKVAAVGQSLCTISH